MKITRDTEYRKYLLDEQRSRMGVGTRREGVHVSDLIMCIRKAWAEKQSGLIEEIPDQTILTWLRGLSHEALLSDGIEQVRAGHCFQCQKTHTMTPQIAANNLCPDCGDTLLIGTIDWVTFEVDGQLVVDFVPVEMKSTLKSSNKTLEEGDMLWFVDQIKTYMWMHSRPAGRVCILHVMGDYSRTDPDVRSGGPQAELRVYGVEWEDAAERDAWGAELERSKALVEGTELPELDERSPRHSMICEYCVVGELLPDGSQCQLFPWDENGIRKGSKLAQRMTLAEMEEELNRMTEGKDDA